MAVWLLSACSSQKKEDRGDIQVLMKDSVDANGLQRPVTLLRMGLPCVIAPAMTVNLEQ